MKRNVDIAVQWRARKIVPNISTHSLSSILFRHWLIKVTRLNDRYYSAIILIDRRFEFRIITHNFANVVCACRSVGSTRWFQPSCTQSREVALLLINRSDSVVSFEPSHNSERTTMLIQRDRLFVPVLCYYFDFYKYWRRILRSPLTFTASRRYSFSSFPMHSPITLSLIDIMQIYSVVHCFELANLND